MLLGRVARLVAESGESGLATRNLGLRGGDFFGVVRLSFFRFLELFRRRLDLFFLLVVHTGEYVAFRAQRRVAVRLSRVLTLDELQFRFERPEGGVNILERLFVFFFPVDSDFRFYLTVCHYTPSSPLFLPCADRYSSQRSKTSPGAIKRASAGETPQRTAIR